jgi:Transposase DDE domain
MEAMAMILNAVFENFVQASPISVMFRATLERALSVDDLDRLFQDTADQQYTRTLLFSSVVDIMSLVVTQIRPSVHAAYQAMKDRIAVSVRALYDKLCHLEPGLAAALVRHSVTQLLPVVQELRGGVAPLLPGYRVRILDGNHLAATEHRLKELRTLAAGPLPGQTLVVLDPEWRMVTDIIPEEDGHAQERSLLPEVLKLVQANDVWVADRNFCTTMFLFGIATRRGYFVIREHAQNVPWTAAGPRRFCGHGASGKVYEQRIELPDGAGQVLHARRITICLDEPTRDGDTEIHILTNLPEEAVTAEQVAELYRQRWTIENAFGELTNTLSCEVNTLAYPRAALFAFAVAVVAYNLLSTVKAALRAEHGVETIEENLSAYYVAEEVAATYRGMMIAIPEEHWEKFGTMPVRKFAAELKRLAGNVRLEMFQKHKRGPKKPRVKRKYDKSQPHISTARVLARRGNI